MKRNNEDYKRIMTIIFYEAAEEINSGIVKYSLWKGYVDLLSASINIEVIDNPVYATSVAEMLLNANVSVSNEEESLGCAVLKSALGQFLKEINEKGNGTMNLNISGFTGGEQSDLTKQIK